MKEEDGAGSHSPDFNLVANGSIEVLGELEMLNDISTTDKSENMAGDNKIIENSSDSESLFPRKRVQWDSQWEFLFSCISMSVGLGNVWRFPVTAYQNGGGAFLIPYLIVLCVIGRPFYFLELTLGQFSSYSQIKAWKLLPLFKGVGLGAMFSTMSVITYYVSIMALTVHYFFASFQAILPWARCDEKWAGTGNCNGSASGTNMSVPEMYYLREVIKEVDSLDNGIGYPDRNLIFCLLFSWFLIFVSIIKGVKSSGKVSYFTTIFPYFVMIILLVRGLTLEGASTGVMFFIKPRWEKILEPSVWYAAVTQCFFSLNAGFGSIIFFASHNPFRHNIYRDAWIVALMDTMTSVISGLIIFAVLGHLASELGTDVANVVNGGGAGLAFVSYADAIATIKWYPQIFAALFFLMLFTLGLGSTISDVGTIITIFCDRYPKIIRWKVNVVVCIVGCAVGTVYTTPGGQYILDLVDFFGGTFVIFFTAILEFVGIAWVYGIYNYLDDIEFMLNRRIGWYLKICWGIVIPIFMTIILTYSLIEDISPTHNNLPYPPVALVCGWLIAMIVLMCVPAAAIHSVVKNEGHTWKAKFFGALKPTKSWGPRDEKIRQEWLAFKASRPEIPILERIRQWKL